MKLFVCFVCLTFAAAQAPPPRSGVITDLDEIDRLLEEDDVAALVGRPQVQIFVHIFGDSGLSKQQLNNDVELILRRSGVPVIPSVGGAPDNSGRLMVTVRIAKSSGGTCAYYVRAEFRESAMPLREPSKRSRFVATWSTDELGTVGLEKISQVRQPVRDAAEKFALHYLKANPR